MLRGINFRKLFNKQNRLGLEHSSQLLLKVEFGFVANAQVSYRDESGYLRIKRFCSNMWEMNLMKVKSRSFLAEMKVFVYTPGLKKNEEVKLSLSIDGQLIEEKVYPIYMEHDYAGWFALAHQL